MSQVSELNLRNVPIHKNLEGADSGANSFSSPFKRVPKAKIRATPEVCPGIQRRGRAADSVLPWLRLIRQWEPGEPLGPGGLDEYLQLASTEEEVEEEEDIGVANATVCLPSLRNGSLLLTSY